MILDSYTADQGDRTLWQPLMDRDDLDLEIYDRCWGDRKSTV